MKKVALYILILIMLTGILSPVFRVYASEENPKEACIYKDSENPDDPTTAVNYPCVNQTTAGSSYHLLAPILNTPEGNDFNPAQDNALGAYLNLMIKIFIGISAVMAVIMIVVGGLEYMTSELPGNKEHGKTRITEALLGLLVALGAYAILNTINPDLLNTKINIPQTTIEAEADVPQTYNPTTKKYNNGYVFGAAWDDSVGKNPTLPYGVYVKTPECTSVGQPDCTSIRGLIPSALQSIQEGCRCNLTISGGTEFWLHGGQSGSTTHQPGGSTVDLRSTAELNAYLSKGQPLANFTRYPPPNGPLYEMVGGEHWHIGP